MPENNSSSCSSARKPTRTCIIVDDERRGREFLAGLLRTHFPDILIAGQAQSVDEAVVLVTSLRPDIIFLDIEIIGGTGFDVLERIGTGHFGIIFITAYDNYRAESALYPRSVFLLKPVSLMEVREAVERVAHDC